MTRLSMVKTSQSIEEIKEESEQLRKEIKELKAEALRRLTALEESLGVSSNTNVEKEQAITSLRVADAIEDEGLLPAPPPIVIKSSDSKKRKGVGDLLDETVWKVSLSIGREPGTWMPKTWGTSGQRLNLSFKAEFTPSQLYERDDFLRGGYTNAKILHVLDGQVTLSPSLTEGQRIYKVKNGGWQVTQGDGPLGTDLLRFYIELDDEVTHKGSDLYIPKGRVYCSCGYFPLGDSKRNRSEPNMKESYAKELASIEDEIVKLRQQKDEIKNPFSMDKIKLSNEIGKLQRKAELTAGKLNFASVTEPNKSLLRFTEDMDVGLTKEGGVCCEVEKSPMMKEYHILGRFSIANVKSSK
ncbi:hypothetical protein ACHAWO_001026 [Cyclotella atomus]|uniref:Uncharacterized protein n=1 Tax=Cyclotella atomus TaxID=382360 RepID=A0ABD3NL29_9STRA